MAYDVFDVGRVLGVEDFGVTTHIDRSALTEVLDRRDG